MKWWEIGIIKIALLSVGIAIGANWPEIFARYAWGLFIFGVALGLYDFYLWAKK
jgi:hypothetical protein